MKAHARTLLPVLLLAAGLACDSGDDGADPDAWRHPCGIAEYQWLPAEGMGHVTDHRKIDIWSLPRSTIESLLSSQGYDALEIRYGAQVYQYRYTTQDRGVPLEATGVLAVPWPDDEQPMEVPYILWLHGTAGFSDACAESQDDHGGPPSAALLASQGYIAVAPDYLGMNGLGPESDLEFHPYLVDEATAIASLDALRAAGPLLDALADDLPAEITPTGQTVIWGGSQGGHATLATERLAPHYAPEVNVAAALALLAPADLVGQAEAALSEWQPGSMIMAAAVMALSRWYGHHDRITDVLRNDEPHHIADTLADIMDNTCGGVDEDQYELDDLDDVFNMDFVASVQDGSWARGDNAWYCMMAENSMVRTSVPRISDVPMLVVQSEQDELESAEVERAAFDTLCAQGYRAEYIECKGASHTQGAAWTLPDQFDWAAARLRGEPLTASCVRGPPECCSQTDAGPCVD